MPPVARVFMSCCVGVTYGDYRDWEAVDAWADRIVKEFKVSVAANSVNSLVSNR